LLTQIRSHFELTVHNNI